jgi:hypothetical protein
VKEAELTKGALSFKAVLISLTSPLTGLNQSEVVLTASTDPNTSSFLNCFCIDGKST